MLPVDFQQANFTFKKPDTMTDEDCGELRVFKGHFQGSDGQKYPCIISKWQPSKEDIDAIVNGAPIYLSITGHALPPVALFTEDPFNPELVNAG